MSNLAFCVAEWLLSLCKSMPIVMNISSSDGFLGVIRFHLRPCNFYLQIFFFGGLWDLLDFCVGYLLLLSLGG